MATDRSEHRIEPLEGRNYFAALAFAPTINGPGFDSTQKYIPAGDNVIVAGLFSGSVNFGAAGQKTILTARGDTDIYVASYGKSGRLNWVRQLGGDFTNKTMDEYKRREILTNPKRLSAFVGRVGQQPLRAGEYVTDLAVDSAGNVILAAAFNRALALDGKTIVSDQSVDKNSYDGLIVKFAPGGAVAWSRSFGGPFDDVPTSVALDGSDNVYVGGYYTRRADFDPTRRTLLLETDGRDAGFVMRLGSGGAVSWIYQFSSDEADRNVRNAVNDIAVTSKGDVVFAGTFAGTADFDPSKGRYELEADRRTDAVVGKLTRKGALAWVESTGGKQFDGNTAITLDASGNVYTAGYFGDDIDADPRANVTNLLSATPENGDSNAEFTDILVSKFTPAGTPVWQGQMGGENIELVEDIQAASDGSIYVAGSFFGTADFAPGRSAYNLTSTLTNDGSIKDSNTTFGRKESYDWFLVRLSPRGKFVSGIRQGGADDDYLSSLTLANDAVYLSGRQVSAPATVKHDDRNESASVIVSSVAG